jgi:hypothetical protein
MYKRRIADNCQYFFLFQLFYKVTIGFNKMAFLLLYYRVFSSRGFRIVCTATIAVVLLGTTAFFIATVVECIPVEKSWNKTVPGNCINNGAFRWSWAGYNTATDLFITFMPMPVIRRLQMDRTKKAGLVTIFALGLFVCATSAFRMQALVASTHASDTPWDSTPAFIWSEVEAAVGLFCVCLPSLKKPISRLLPKSWSKTLSRNRSKHGMGYGSAFGEGKRGSKFGLPLSGQSHSFHNSNLDYPDRVGTTCTKDYTSDSEEHMMEGITVKRDITVAVNAEDEHSFTGSEPDERRKQSLHRHI